MNIVRFDQTAKTLAEQFRFRRIGNPFAFLEAIGFPAVREELYRGANIVDVAAQINVSVTVLRTWLENHGYMKEVDEATPISADGYLSEGQRLLKEAQTEFDLRKAKELINHARWMAERLNKKQYGKAETGVSAQAGVQFNFVINGERKELTIHEATNAEATPEIKPDVPSFTLEAKRTYALPEPIDIGPFEPEPFDPAKAPIPAHLQPIIAGN